MTTFFPKYERTYLESFFIKLLKTGDIPEHVAFIMDGNRRYAKRINADRATGHSKGFGKLAETLSWCRDLGVKQATVYAFSIENFKRSPDEVECLLNLFREQFAKLLEEFDKFIEYDVCVRFFGKLDLLPIDIQKAMAKITLQTRLHKRFHFNVCISYTAREEICRAISDISTIVHEDERLSPSDITDHLLTEAMYSSGLKDPDILLRTSGEIRLSDFLLWQTSYSYVAFVDDLWPDLSIWSFFKVIIQYQLESSNLKKRKSHYQQWLDEQEYFHVKNQFLEQNTFTKFEDFLIEKRKKLQRTIEAIYELRLEAYKHLTIEDDDDDLGSDGDGDNKCSKILHSKPLQTEINVHV